ncbi:MAG: FadR/GntR family transcriptional regulator, partial [Rhodovulum sp.]
IEDIYQLRRALEPEMAADLAGRLNEDDLAGLEDIMAAYATPAETPEEERAQHVASLQFHARLAELSGNRLLGLIVGFITAALSDLTVYRQLYDPPNRTLWERGRAFQAELIAAFRARDPEAARRIMAAHMHTAESLMTEQQAHVLRRFMRPSP